MATDITFALGCLAGAVINPVFIGTLFGLVAGKQIGIFILSWLTVKSDLATLPRRG